MFWLFTLNTYASVAFQYLVSQLMHALHFLIFTNLFFSQHDYFIIQKQYYKK